MVIKTIKCLFSDSKEPHPKLIKSQKIQFVQSARLNSTHNSISNVLLVGQIFGLMPLDNLTSSEPQKVAFRWLSPKILYIGILCFGTSTCFVTSLLRATSQDTFFHYLSSPSFYLSACVLLLIFVKIARNWPNFLYYATKLEGQTLPNYTINDSTNLQRQLYFFAILLSGACIVEHTLSIANVIFSRNCQSEEKGQENYLHKQFRSFFMYFPFNAVVGIFLWIQSYVAAVIWSSGDIFIISLSLILTEKYRQVTSAIKSHLNLTYLKKRSKIFEIPCPLEPVEKPDLKFWRDLREYYNKINILNRKAEVLISDLVLFSYSSNLFFILIQLFISIKHRDNTTETLYFFFSFAFVIFRTVLTSIMGGKIQEETIAALEALNLVPSEIYNEEIARLAWQMHVTPPVLTGHKFFILSKRLVLSVAAAIVTYELVLIQFNSTTFEEKAVVDNNTRCY